MFDKLIAVCRSVADTFFCVTGGYDENELILVRVASVAWLRSRVAGLTD